MISYPFFLIALFVVGLGFAMLQIAANPYITILGPERTASSRLNLSQAFNSFGTTIGPIIAGLLIFKVFNGPGSHGAQSVKIPYLCVGGVFLVLAVCFMFGIQYSFMVPMMSYVYIAFYGLYGYRAGKNRTDVPLAASGNVPAEIGGI